MLIAAKGYKTFFLANIQVFTAVLIPGKYNAFKFNSGMSRYFLCSFQIILKLLNRLPFFKTVIMAESMCRYFMCLSLHYLFDQHGAKMIWVNGFILTKLFKVSIVRR